MIPKPISVHNSRPQPQRRQSSSPSPSPNPGARKRLRIWMAFMVIFLGWATYSFIQQSLQLSAKHQEFAVQQQQQAQTQAALDQSQLELKRLEDPEYIGQIARKQYGMYLPGEKPIWATEPSANK
ncbi:septum formation initiator family protein [Paenibacillus campi]|uniref:septum formation initiator family protein n=1 Tax=Paenibacillus campi TaxID=3106031 RepID=UPI002B0009EF|nr:MULTISPECIES: septum formation initiator family protein [unclassified Paenibacillus]